jgi:hypothetical protein
MKALNVKIGKVPTTTAVKGIITCLGSTDISIKTIDRVPNPNQEMAANNLNLLTYFSGAKLRNAS